MSILFSLLARVGSQGSSCRTLMECDTGRVSSGSFPFPLPFFISLKFLIILYSYVDCCRYRECLNYRQCNFCISIYVAQRKIRYSLNTKTAASWPIFVPGAHNFISPLRKFIKENVAVRAVFRHYCDSAATRHFPSFTRAT